MPWHRAATSRARQQSVAPGKALVCGAGTGSRSESGSLYRSTLIVLCSSFSSGSETPPTGVRVRDPSYRVRIGDSSYRRSGSETPPHIVQSMTACLLILDLDLLLLPPEGGLHRWIWIHFYFHPPRRFLRGESAAHLPRDKVADFCDFVLFFLNFP